MDESIETPAVRPCRKCGASDRYPNGRCRPCQRTRYQQLGATQAVCGKCGASDRLPSGACRPCQRASQERLAATQTSCVNCGARDRNAGGQCRPCVRASGAKRAKENAVCLKCGARDRGTTGACRSCARRVGEEMYEAQTSCAVCGATARNNSGQCRDCKRRRDRLGRGIVGANGESGVGRLCALRGCGTVLTGSRGDTAAHFDHDHSSGLGRDWLCGRHNVAIGGFADSPALLRAAADYLELWVQRHAALTPSVSTAADPAAASTHIGPSWPV